MTDIVQQYPQTDKATACNLCNTYVASSIVVTGQYWMFKGSEKYELLSEELKAELESSL